MRNFTEHNNNRKIGITPKTLGRPVQSADRLMSNSATNSPIKQKYQGIRVPGCEENDIADMERQRKVLMPTPKSKQQQNQNTSYREISTSKSDITNTNLDSTSD